MKLNHKGFFAQKFLQVTEWDYPRTICELVTRTMLCSLIYLLLLMVALFVLGAFGNTLLGLVAVALGHLNWSDLYLSEVDRTLMMVTVILTTIGISAGSVAMGKHYFREYKNRVRNLAATDPNYIAPQPNPLVEFSKGVWSRVKDKTCVVIQYENDPAEIRRKEEEERQKYYEALYAKAREEDRLEAERIANLSKNA